ncbi:MAG: hypothetical protein ACKVT2_13805 [Saprospiraceae bacterium]
MMKNIKLFLPVLFILCSFCKKDSPIQVEQILVDGTWYQKAYLTDDDGDGVFTDASLPCQYDDGWKFTSDNKFELRDEVEYCDTDVDSVFVIPGTWLLQNNETEIQIEIGGGFLILDCHIHSINDTLLELRLYNDPVTQAPPEERFVLRR